MSPPRNALVGGEVEQHCRVEQQAVVRSNIILLYK